MTSAALATPVVRVRPLLFLLVAASLSLPLPEDSARADPAVTAQPYPSITIDGDAAWTNLFTGVRSGHGTATDPYVISDLHIQKTRGWGIHLIDTRAHVVIQDVFFHGAAGTVTRYNECFPPVVNCPVPSAIWLDRAENVTVQRVHVVLDEIGVRIEGAKHITLRDIRLGPGEWMVGGLVDGVLLVDSSDVRMEGLSVTATDFPLRLGRSTDVTVVDSTFVSGQIQLGFGTSLTDATFRDNTFTGTAVYAFGTMTDLLLVGNSFSGSAVGLGSGGFTTTRFDGLHVCGNTFARHTNIALDVPRGRDVTIEGNSFDLNRDAVRVGAAVTGTLDVHDNTVTRSSRYGLDLRVIAQTANGNHLAGNAFGHILAAPATDAVGNWWGHDSGPSGIGPGTGDRLADLGMGAFYAPWLSDPPTPAVTCP